MYKKHFDAVLAAWNEGKLDGLDKYVGASTRRRAPSAVNGNADNLIELKKLISDFRIAFPDTHVALDEFYSHEDRAFTRWTFTGTNTGPGVFPATGKKIKLEGATFCRFESGKMVDEIVYFDALELMTQLGLVDLHLSHA